MSAATYAVCDSCGGKVFYVGEEDVPLDAVVTHVDCQLKELAKVRAETRAEECEQARILNLADRAADTQQIADLTAELANARQYGQDNDDHIDRLTAQLAKVRAFASTDRAYADDAVANLRQKIRVYELLVNQLRSRLEATFADLAEAVGPAFTDVLCLCTDSVHRGGYCPRPGDSDHASCPIVRGVLPGSNRWQGSGWREVLADMRRVGWRHTAKVAEAGCDPDTGAHLWAYEHTWKRGTEAITVYVDYPERVNTGGFVTWWTPDVHERQWYASLHVDLIKSAKWLRIGMSALGILTPPTVSPSGSGTPPS